MYVCMYVCIICKEYTKNPGGKYRIRQWVITHSHPLELLLFSLEVIICQGHCLQLIIGMVWYGMHVCTCIIIGTIGKGHNTFAPT